MAYDDSSAAPRAAASAMANPGYGKRLAPGQAPRRKGDFAHLPRREAAIAALIDALPEGAAMDAKTLAKLSPDYGQAACRSALNRLHIAGHLRRFRERVQAEDGGMRWVTRTYFSRTARDDGWWERFWAGDVVEEGVAAPPPMAPAARPARSRAYAALAGLTRADDRLALSAADCAALEPLAAEWLARGAGESQLVSALTAGLPPQVHAPAALMRIRLVEKLPPEREPEPEPEARRAPLRIMECAVCGVPGRPDALPGGTCRDCRGESRAPEPYGLSAAEVRARVAELRVAARAPERNRT
ncbi:hypothetical protein [Streptomyces sp. NPDC053079]|uniref:hypothetical protein n=1 Tax=Streptomyces sp. NPDC053079 TaxID=3365697 RepID=UPI0037D703A9